MPGSIEPVAAEQIDSAAATEGGQALEESRNSMTLADVRSLNQTETDVDDGFSIRDERDSVSDQMERTDFYDLADGKRLMIENPDPDNPNSSLYVGLVHNDKAIMPIGGGGSGDARGNWTQSHEFEDGSRISFQSGSEYFEYTNPSGHSERQKLKRPIRR